MPIRVFERVADSSGHHLLQQEDLAWLLPARRFGGLLELPSEEFLQCLEIRTIVVDAPWVVFLRDIPSVDRFR